MNRLLQTVAIVAVLVFYTSCEHNSTYEHFYTIDSKGWDKDSTLVFPIQVKEANHDVHSLQVNIRNKNDYAFSNLWLFVNIESPSGEQLIDTVEFTLASPSGKWLGTGLGDLFDNKFSYKQNIAFPDSGLYRIHIQQGMRNYQLQGIDAVGISVENVK
ncbi:MAG: gliding motility lipoprotein GldH [Mangrovibacterium sp.]